MGVMYPWKTVYHLACSILALIAMVSWSFLPHSIRLKYRWWCIILDFILHQINDPITLYYCIHQDLKKPINVTCICMLLLFEYMTKLMTHMQRSSSKQKSRYVPWLAQYLGFVKNCEYFNFPLNIAPSIVIVSKQDAFICENPLSKNLWVLKIYDDDPGKKTNRVMNINQVLQLWLMRHFELEIHFISFPA